MAIPTGIKAPEFTLKTKTADGLHDIKLSDNFGRKNTVLLFVPLAFTGVCTKELCDVSAGLSAYESLNAQVIGIGGRMHTEAEMLAIVDAFLSTPWSEAPRHQRRIDILADYERTHVAPPVPGAQ